jgi:hypothetical protein
LPQLVQASTISSTRVCRAASNEMVSSDMLGSPGGAVARHWYRAESLVVRF